MSKKTMRWFLSARTALLEAGYPHVHGVTLYEGPSLVTGEMIRVLLHIAPTLAEIRVISEDYENEAALSLDGHDDTMCAQCPHRPYLGGYCREMILRTLPTRAMYPFIDDIPQKIDLLRGGLVVCWFDPSAVPIEALSMLRHAEAVERCQTIHAELREDDLC